MDTEILTETAKALTLYLQSAGVSMPSVDLITRFLVGINVPVFTRTKAKSVPGFGIAESMRYSDVLDVLKYQ